MLLDSMIKEALRTLKRARASHCPDEETIASYASNALEGAEREEVESHLVRCESCLDLVVLCSSIEREQVGLEMKKPPFDVVVSFLKNTVEFIKKGTEIEVIPPLLPVLTRSQRVLLPNHVRFQRVFGDIAVEVEIERVGKDTGEIKVWVMKDMACLDKTRVSLVKDDRELASYPNFGGCVLFEDVKFGRYVIRVSRRNEYIGEISLRVMEG